jgi:hypothetical protein
MRQGIIQLKRESIEHEKREAVRIDAEKIGKRLKKTRWSYADSLALPVGFARREYPLHSNYPTTTKSSMGSKIQMIGWLIT